MGYVQYKHAQVLKKCLSNAHVSYANWWDVTILLKFSKYYKQN